MAKKEYIERSELKQHLRSYAGMFTDELGFVVNLQAVLNGIDFQPAVDVVEARRGKWVEWYPPKHMIMTGEELLYRCSACDAKYADVEGYRYCPYCGAKMGGAEDG